MSGKPESSSFFVNPIQPKDTTSVPEITKISSIGRSEFAKDMPNPRRFDEALWHADGQFETVPPSFTSLRLSEVPKTGGDTLWASGYELYDRFSQPLRSFFEGLTATFIGDGYTMSAEKFKDRMEIHDGPRGSPQNVGKELKAVHPVVRTHPVSGWKCIFPVGPRDPRDYGAPKYINELSTLESERILGWFYDLVSQNHDMSVRFRWRNKNDMGSSVSASDFVDADVQQRSGTTAVLSTVQPSTTKVLVRGLVYEWQALGRRRISTLAASHERMRWLVSKLM